MKQLLPSIVMLFLAFSGPAASNAFTQGTDKVVQKGAESFRYHYFQGSTKVSTVWHLPQSGQKGYAVAYNRAGEEIYRQELSRMHMIQSVRFSYHPNGAVSVARYSWHPDAGIQSGGTTTTFDDQGNKTGESEDIDPHQPLKAPGRPVVDPIPATRELRHDDPNTAPRNSSPSPTDRKSRKKHRVDAPSTLPST